MSSPQLDERFQAEIAPHINGAYNLAYWLTSNRADADDVLQEATVRAWRFLADRRELEARAWFFQIVRNASYSLLKRKKLHLDIESEPEVVDQQDNAELNLLKKADALELRNALEKISPEYREVLILREWEDLSYQEIAEVLQIPQGTVMSRLSRAKAALKQVLLDRGGRDDGK